MHLLTYIFKELIDNSFDAHANNVYIYLDETDLLRIVGSANNMLEYVCSLESLDDA